jgi:hypothetical protein
MIHSTWRRWRNWSVFAKNRKRARQRPARFRPWCESLESRLTPSTDQWTGANHMVDNNWSDPLNWSEGLVPGAGDIAYFTISGPQSLTSNIDTAFTVAGISIDSTWGGTINVDAGLTVTGDFSLASGAFQGNGAVSFAGSASTWTGGGIYLGSGGLTNTGTITIDTTLGDMYLEGDGTLTNQGTINLQGGNTFFVQNGYGGTNLINQGTLDFTDDSDLGTGGGGYVENTSSGTVEKTGGSGVTTIYGVFFDYGGKIDAEAATLGIEGEGTHTLLDGGLLEAGGDGSTTAVLDLAYNGQTPCTGSFTGSGSGTINVGNNGTLLVSSAGATFNFPGQLFQWNAGTIDVASGGTLTNAAGSVLNVDTMGGNVVLNGSLSVGGTLANNGTISVKGGNGLGIHDDATLSNAATLDFTDNAGITAPNLGDGSNGGTLANAGTGIVEKTGGSGTSALNCVLGNAGGIFDAESGTLGLSSYAGGLFNGGVLEAGVDGSTTAVLDLAYHATLNYQGTFTGSGAGTLALDTGTLAITSAGATFNFPGRLFQWTAGGIDVSSGGTLTNAAGSVLNLDTTNSSLVLHGNGQGVGGLLNDGTIIETGDSYLQVQFTTLNNMATFNFTGDATLQTFYGALDNSGTMKKTAGTGTSVIGSPFYNTGGTLDAESGTLALEASSGQLTGGVLEAGVGGSKTAVLDLAYQATVKYQGTFTGSGAGTVALDAGTLAVTSAGASFDLPGKLFQWTAAGTIDVSSGGTFTNAKGGTLNLNQAPFLVLNGSGSNSGTLANGGTIDATGWGTLYLENGATLSNAGTFDFLANGNVSQMSGGTLLNTGTFKKTKGTGTSTVSTSTFSNTGTVSVSSGTLDIAATVTQVSGTTLTAGTWKITGSTRVLSTLDITSAGSFTTIGKAKITLSGPGSTFTNLGGLAMIDVGGSFTLAGGQSFTTAGPLTNAGALTLGPTSILTVSGSFTQSSSGTLTTQLGGTDSAPTFGQLVCTTGTVTLAGKLTGTSTVVPAVGSSFEILDSEGNAAINGMFLQGTTFTIRKGGTTMTFQISYAGSDGDGSNNVVITRIS